MAFVASRRCMAVVASRRCMAVVASRRCMAAVASRRCMAFVASRRCMAVVASRRVISSCSDRLLYSLLDPFTISAHDLSHLRYADRRFQLGADFADEPIRIASTAVCAQSPVHGHELPTLWEFIQEPTVSFGTGTPAFYAVLGDCEIVSGLDSHDVELLVAKFNVANAK